MPPGTKVRRTTTPRRCGCVLAAGTGSYAVPGMVRMPCSLYMREPHSHRRAGPLGALGTRRSDYSEGRFKSEGPTRPMRTRRRRFRIAFRIAKVLLVVVVLFAVAAGLLFLLTPSAGQATALVRAQAPEHHIAYPPPPGPPCL